MKRILSLLLILSACIIPAGAGIERGTSLDRYKDVVSLGRTQAGTYSVDCSSITATLIKPANEIGTAFNYSNYDAWFSTYAATSNLKLYPVKANTEMNDDISTYTGAWYILGAAGQATTNFRIIRKW